jgi:hypothetical protein
MKTADQADAGSIGSPPATTITGQRLYAKRRLPEQRRIHGNAVALIMALFWSVVATVLSLAAEFIDDRILVRRRLTRLLVMLLASIGTIANGQTLSVSGGFQPDMFTWLSEMQISGTGFTPTLPYSVFLHGPIGLPGVTADDRQLPTIFANANGNLSATVVIPYRDLSTVNAALTPIPRPGYYELRVVGPSGETVSKWINLCPETIPTAKFGQVINWGVSRGGRDGWLEDKSPERTDPEWMSVWDEKPVGIYATVAESEGGGSDQPDFISHHELPASHFGHDVIQKLVPDLEYRWVLGTANFGGDADEAEYGRIEFEWEVQNDGRPFFGSYGTGNIGLPLWAVATSGDRVYTVGRWALDHGHLEHGDRTEMHPPRLLAAIRKHHTVVPLDAGGHNTRASQVDIYVSGHGGGSNKFYDGLSAALDHDGRGGGRIEEIMPIGDPPAPGMPWNLYYTYFSYGPSASWIVDALKLYQDVVVDVEPEIAGPSGIATNSFGNLVRVDDPSAVTPWVQGPEERPINDMNYDFDVPLPAPPSDATQIQALVTTHAEHTTGVEEEITYTEPDPTSGLPTKAHIHLPYLGADNGIYARTLNFYWDTYNAPGRHFVVTMDKLTFFLPKSFSGRAYVWTDVAGQRISLTDLDPDRILDAANSLGTSFLPGATFDVYLDPDEELRVFTHGYDQQALDDLFGVDVGIPAYDGALHILNKYIDGQLSLNPNNGDSETLGGALYEGAPIPLVPAAGGILGHHAVLSSPFYFATEFTVSYVPDPRLKVTGVPADFGQVCVGTSVDRVIHITNAAVGLNNNDPYANLGVDTMNVALTLNGAGLSLVPASAPASFTLDAGQSEDVTVRFTPTAVGQDMGSITILSNDARQPALTYDFCGEAVPTGVRALVVQRDGTPYPVVDSIKLTSYGIKPNAATPSLKGFPLEMTDAPSSCATVPYHYMSPLASTGGSQTSNNYYELRVQVGEKKATTRFTLEDCEFKDLVITLP